MPDGTYKDETVLRELYIDENLSLREVAERYDVDTETIRYWKEKFGLEKDRSAYVTGPPVPEGRLRELYWEDGLSQSDVAEELGYSAVSIRKWMHEYGIETRGPAGSPDPPLPEDELRRLYCDEQLGSRPIAERVGVARNTIRRWLDTFGIEKHPPGNAKRYQVSDERVRRLYVDKELTQAQVADTLDLGVNQTTISRWLRDMGVELRNQAGWGQLLDTERGETVKSALERDIANWLYEHGIDYEYEPDLDGTVYIPDFRVGERLIEGWGVRQLDRYDERREHKIETYEALGYEVISVFPLLDDRAGVDDVLPTVAWEQKSTTNSSGKNQVSL